jgi:hypothetical protein
VKRLDHIDATAMDEKELTRRLRAWEPARDHAGWRCPDEARLAAYVEHRLPVTDQARIEAHLADCAACLGQVAFLIRQPAGAVSSVDPQVLSRARDLVPPVRSFWAVPLMRWDTVTAAAACVVLAVGLFRLQAPQAPLVEPRAPAAPATVAPARSLRAEIPAPSAAVRQPAPRPAPAVRNSVGTAMAFHLLFPAENATLSPLDLKLQWNAVPGAAYYEAQVMTDEGNVAWSARTATTSVRLPGDGASLQAGKKYFVWIRAYLAGGGTMKSAAVSFHIADR